MSIVLHRFALSHYSEKARVCLDFKRLDYTVEQHQHGAAQLGVWRLSGQRKLPVIEHDGAVIHDSTAIALHLDHAFPDGPALLPRELRARREVLELEDRLDAELGPHVPVIAFDHLQRDPEVRALSLRALLPSSPVTRAALGLSAVASRPAMWIPSTRARVDAAYAQVRATLAHCVERLADAPYLTGDAPTLADLAAVGLSFNLRYPRSAHLAEPGLAGRGVPELVNDPTLSRFFQWRDEVYARFLK